MRSRVAWPILLREHAANDIFVDLDAEGMGDLLGDAHTAICAAMRIWRSPRSR